MKPELIPPTANHVSTFAHSAKRTRKQWCPCALALAIMLGLAAVPPSAQGQTFTLLYSFTGGADGGGSNARVIRDTAGNLYGTTQYGGDLTCNGGSGCGTVFKLETTGKETVLHSFTGGADGAIPLAGLIRDAAGNLYGTTQFGGDLTCDSGGGCGTVFKLDTTGKETVLHSFTGKAGDGAYPVAGVIRDAAGNLYGTTEFGGASDNGTVFKVDKTSKETVLHSFLAKAGDGADPVAGVIRDAAGNLYGTTLYGASGHGTVFKLDTTGKETVLHSFTGGADGGGPFAGLIPVGANLYGTTVYGGGASGHGTVFKVDKTGKETVVYRFTGSDGHLPEAGVIRDAAGNLYGTTIQGGDLNCAGSFGFGCGVVFKLDTTGKETVLYSFTGGADGSTPAAGLVRDAAGNLYGTTIQGGDLSCASASGCGTVFKIAP